MSLLLYSGIGSGGTISVGGGVGGDPGSTLLSRTITQFGTGEGFGNGSIGFWMPVTERTNLGTLYYPIQRVHGSAGTVSVTWTIYDEDGTTVLATGTLTWLEGEQDIKIVSTTVSSKSNGQYRNHCRLSSATGGASLAKGSLTRCWGVINDGSVADDADAVFFNSAAAGGGDGSSSTPYNNIYTAITTFNSSGKRFLYLRGSVNPDGTNTSNPYGTGGMNTLPTPSARSGEGTRAIISNWPGFTFEVNGSTGTNKAGFHNSGSAGYHTYYGIDFLNLDAGGVSGVPGFGIWYHYGTHECNTVEHCTFNNINGTENNGGFNAYGGFHAVMWRCTGDDVTTADSPTNHNTASFFSYNGNGHEVSRCYFGSTQHNGSWQKDVEDGQIGLAVNFCIYNNCFIEYLQISGSGGGYSGLIITHNLVKGASGGFNHQSPVADSAFADNQISNNYFYQCGTSVEGAIAVWGIAGLQIFSNVFDNCRYCITDEQNLTGDLPYYFDYNVAYNNVANFAAVNFTGYSAASYASTFTSPATGAPAYCANQVTGNPNGVDPANDDPSLGGSSSATGAGIDGNDCGIYLTGNEVIGNTGIVSYA